MPSSSNSKTQRKLLILCQSQFGYHSDTYYYCKYLKEQFDITYLCWDYNLPILSMKNVKIIPVSRKGNIATRVARYLAVALSVIREEDYDVNFIKYFRGCSLLKILNPSKRFILDLRSGHISHSAFSRSIFNLEIKWESFFFQNITIISQSLAKKLGLEKKASILPLGADTLSGKGKNFKSLRLLYVGTLTQRNIDQSLIGFEKFYNEYKEKIDMHYTIIGSGAHNEENELREIAEARKISSVVSVLGLIPHDQLGPYFDSHNVGIAYVPVTDYFDCQPVTKTLEYLLSGMPVIATATTENKQVLNSDNGVLIKDSPESFYEGLKMLWNKIEYFDSNQIRNQASKNKWESIVNNLSKYIDSLCSSS